MIEGTSRQDFLIEKRGFSKKHRVLFVAALVLFVALAFAIPHYSEILGADVVIKRDSLRIAKVRREDFIREVVSQGRIVAANSPTLFSAEQGFVNLQVKAGDSVSKDQVIATVISPELDELLAREKANHERLEIELRRQKIQSKRRKLELQQSEDLAKVNLVAMDREKRRADKAFELQLISNLDYEKARDDLDRAKLEYEQAIQNNNLEQESLNFDDDTLALQIKSQQVLVEGLQRRVDALSIRSPVEGMVGNVQVLQRQAVMPNQALITVVDLTAFEVEASISEGYADELAPLMLANVLLNNTLYPAELTAISPEVVSGQVITRLRFTETMPEGLRQNQRLTARIQLESKSNVLVVDRGSFVDGFDGSVFKANGNEAERVEVVLGSRSVSQVEIVDGLNENDMIIVSALNVKKHSQKLLITE